MFLTVILNILAVGCQVGVSYLAWEITREQLRSPRRLFLTRAGFVALAVLTSISVSIQAYRSGRTERAHFAMKLSPSYLYQSARLNFMPVGQPLAMNVHYENVGSGSAFNLNAIGYPSLQPDDSIKSQRAAIAEYQEFLKTLPSRPVTTVAKDAENEFTAYGPKVSPEDVDNVVYGRRIMYVVGQVVFEDDYGRRTQDFCQLRQAPGPTGSTRWAWCQEFTSEH